MIRSCTVCTKPVPPRFVLCGECFPAYREFIKTVWFQELIKMQVRQDYITYKEQFTAEDYTVQDTVASSTHWRRNVGRPRVLSRKESEAIVKEFEESLQAAKEGRGKRISFRALARKYNCNRMTISRTIARYGSNPLPAEEELDAVSSNISVD